MSHSFKTLYLLDNEKFIFIEVKRTGLTDEKDPAKIYFWLVYEKATEKIQRLQFVSMYSDEHEEQRVFKEGMLKFDPQKGHYLENGTHNGFELSNLSGHPVPDTLLSRINDFFSGL
ncbi:MAG: hypothetical protein IH595_14515 [Bacteroidales bacterium]|nr:hypothetical protein [Bacteroidales bacterium]